jgi:hypothetical protein
MFHQATKPTAKKKLSTKTQPIKGLNAPKKAQDTGPYQTVNSDFVSEMHRICGC